MSAGKKKPATGGVPVEQGKLSFYPSWCKRCGNCVAFCPRQALATDKWGYPYLADPDRCTTCGLCEMLCPDFALSVGEPQGQTAATSRRKPQSPSEPVLNASPERLAPVRGEDDNG